MKGENLNQAEFNLEPAILALQRWRQKGQEFKVILSYMAQATCYPVSENQNK